MLWISDYFINNAKVLYSLNQKEPEEKSYKEFKGDANVKESRVNFTLLIRTFENNTD